MEGEQNYKVTYFKIGDLAFHTISAEEAEFDSTILKQDLGTRSQPVADHQSIESCSDSSDD